MDKPPVFKQSISPMEWLRVIPETRLFLADHFNIKRSGSTQVEQRGEAYVVSDGFTPTDLEGLTVEKMQEYLGSKESNVHVLFELLVNAIQNPPAPNEVAEVLADKIPSNETPKEATEVKKGTRKSAKK